MQSKSAKADVTPKRQRSQFTCMASSMSMALGALGIEADEDAVNRVMDCRPLQGASWEDAMACAQYYGVRATLVTPCTIGAVKKWTDAGSPVLIGWNPEGRQWSHASLIFDVTENEVHIADPNIPDPDETVRVIPFDEFYKKWFESRGDFLVRRTAMALEREVTVEGKPTMGKTARMARKAIWPSMFVGMARTMKGKNRTDNPVDRTSSPLRLRRDYGATTKEAGEDLWGWDNPHGLKTFPAGKQAQALADILYDLSIKELGINRNFRDMVFFDSKVVTVWIGEDENQAKSILGKVKLEMGNRGFKGKISLREEDGNFYLETRPTGGYKKAKFERGEDVSLEDLPEEMQKNVENPPESVRKVREDMEKQSEEDISAEDYTALLHQARFEEGKPMSVDEVADVVGPEFKKNVEDPPPGVAKLKEEMKNKAASSHPKSDRTACGCEDSDETETSETRTAASGLYGVTKDLEGVCLSAGRKLASSVKKIAREIYSKDEEVPGFLSEHGKRTGNRAAKLLVAAFKDMSPGSKLKTPKTAGPARTGLYGYKERTAKIALGACGALYHQAGLIAGDLHGRRTANYDGITGFFKQHSKAGKCGFSALLLEAYPSAPAQKIASFMLNDQDWNRYLQAADFLASEEEEEEEEGGEGTAKSASLVAIGDAKRFIDALALLMSGDFEGSVFSRPEEVEEEMILILRRSIQHGENISLFIYELARYGKRKLVPLLSGIKPDPIP